MALYAWRQISVELELPFVLRVANGSYECQLDKNSFTVVATFVDDDSPEKNPQVPPTGMRKQAAVVFKPFTGEVVKITGDAPAGMSQRHTHVGLAYGVKVLDGTPLDNNGKSHHLACTIREGAASGSRRRDFAAKMRVAA